MDGGSQASTEAFDAGSQTAAMMVDRGAQVIVEQRYSGIEMEAFPRHLALRVAKVTAVMAIASPQPRPLRLAFDVGRLLGLWILTWNTGGGGGRLCHHPLGAAVDGRHYILGARGLLSDNSTRASLMALGLEQ